MKKGQKTVQPIIPKDFKPINPSYPFWNFGDEPICNGSLIGQTNITIGDREITPYLINVLGETYALPTNAVLTGCLSKCKDFANVIIHKTGKELKVKNPKKGYSKPLEFKVWSDG